MIGKYNQILFGFGKNELPENLCDGLETCGNENGVCSVSTRPQSLTRIVPTTNKGLTKTLSFCLEGLGNLESLLSACVKTQFIYPNGDIFGVAATSVILPNNTQSCDYMYGEQYLYTSCTDHCFASSCPLINIPRYEVRPKRRSTKNICLEHIGSQLRLLSIHLHILSFHWHTVTTLF